jgi:hypothetical protein
LDAFFSLALVLGPGVINAQAGMYTPDQQNTGFRPGLFDQIQAFSPIGQSFTPAQTSLNQVYLFTEAGTNQIGGLYLNIHQDSMTGTIVGTSHPVWMERGFKGVTPFVFLSPVSLITNHLYVMEIVAEPQSGPWLVGSANQDTYAGGTWYLNGQPVPGNDLWFSEGTFGVSGAAAPEHAPEPASIAMLAIGAAGVLAFRWRRRRLG